MGVFAVTGGTGFLGEHLVHQLAADGHQVRVISRDPAPLIRRLPSEVDKRLVVPSPASVLDPRALAEAVRGVDGFFHLAGVVDHSRRAPADVNDLNVQGTLNCLRACAGAGVQRVVYASTSGVCAVRRSPAKATALGDSAPYADDAVRGWPYYESKIEAERASAALAAELGLDLVCMRPTLLLGPGDRRLSSCRLVADLLRGRVPLCPSGGLSFVDVRDVADAFAVAMQRGRSTRDGAGTSTSAQGGMATGYVLGAANMTLREFLAEVERLSGVPAPRVSLPPVVERASAWLLYQAKGRLLGNWDKSLDPVYVEMGQAFWYTDWSAAQRDLGFQPRSPEETLRDTIAWLKSNWGAIAE